MRRVLAFVEKSIEMSEEKLVAVESRGKGGCSIQEVLRRLPERKCRDELLLEEQARNTTPDFHAGARFSQKEGRKVAIEVNKTERETIDEERSNDIDDCHEERTELMNEAGGSIITRGVKFSSVCDFLSFMSGDEAGSEDTEDISEKEGGRVSMYPVVKLKRLSFKNWLQVGKGSWKRIGGPSDVRAKVNVQGQKGLQGKSIEEDIKVSKDMQDSSEDLVDKHASHKSSNYQCMLCIHSSGRRSHMREHLEGYHGMGVGGGM